MPSYSDPPISLSRIPWQRWLAAAVAASALAVLFAFVFGDVHGLVAHRVDDYVTKIQIHFPGFYFLRGDQNWLRRYFDLASSRLFLNKFYGLIEALAGGHYERAYLPMLGVYLVTAFMLLRLVLPFARMGGALAIAAFYFTFWQKQEALVDYTGTVYVIVIGIFIGCLLLERSRLRLIPRYVIIALLLWGGMHLYEILIFAPFVLAAITAGRLWLDEKRWPTRTELIASALPFLTVGGHVLMLTGRANWYTRNPGQWQQYSLMQKLDIGFNNIWNAQLGPGGQSQASYNWKIFWAYVVPSSPTILLLIPVFVVLCVAAVKLSPDRQAPRPGDSHPPQPGRGYTLGLLVGGGALAIFAGLLHIALGVTNGCPGRFLYLPSVGYCLVLAAALNLLRSREVKRVVVGGVFALAIVQALCMRSLFYMCADSVAWDDRQKVLIKDFGWSDLNGAMIYGLTSENAPRNQGAPWRITYSLYYESGSAGFYFWEMQDLDINAVTYQPLKSDTLTLAQLDRLETGARQWRQTHGGPLGVIYFDDAGEVWGLAEIRWLAAGGETAHTLVSEALHGSKSPRVKVLEVTAGPEPKFRLVDR